MLKRMKTLSTPKNKNQKNENLRFQLLQKRTVTQSLSRMKRKV